MDKLLLFRQSRCRAGSKCLPVLKTKCLSVLKAKCPPVLKALERMLCPVGLKAGYARYSPAHREILADMNEQKMRQAIK